MKNIFKQEVYYLIHSKMLWILSASVVLLVILGAIQSVNQQKSNLIQFEETRKLYSTETAFLKDLNIPYKEEQSQEGKIINDSVTNAANYSFSNLKKSNFQLTLLGFPLFIVKYIGLILFPLIIGISAILIATNDYVSGTYKRKLGFYKWNDILAGKLFAGLSILSNLYILAIFLSMIFGIFLSKLIDEINLNKYKGSVQLPTLTDGIKLVFSVFMIGIIIFIICFFTALAIKNRIVSLVAFLIYNLIIPNFGRYDFKNAIMNLFSKASDKILGQQVPVIPVNQTISATLIIIYLLLIVSGSLIVFNRYTKYTL